ncbi:MAG: RES family NAD+ phosphorylase [Devosia sp.]
MIAIPTPPAGLTCHPFEIVAGKELVRMHDAARAGTVFNPGFGKSRFAPFADMAGASVPTAYAATTFDCAAFEYVFHDINPAAAFKTVPFGALNGIGVSMISPTRNLKLASFFEIDLNGFGLTRGQLIDTPASTYSDTAAWAKAVHALADGFDGMIWTSRKCDPDLAMIIFGDRVVTGDLELMSTGRLTHSAEYLSRLHELGKRAGIDIVL